MSINLNNLATFPYSYAAAGNTSLSMAYNPVAQVEEDAPSDSEYSHISASPSDNHEAMPAPQQSSHDLGITPLRSRNVSNASSVPLRHPTPDLQSLKGAYVGNIERLEQSAERLSMSSDIGEELRKLKMEQKKSESRRSSMMNKHIEEDEAAPALVTRQFSYGQGSHTSKSLVDMNNIARAGGFSPTGYFASPRSSIRSGSWSQHNSAKGRSASQASRLTGMLEPEPTSIYVEPLGSGSCLPIIAPLRPLPKELRGTNDGELVGEEGNVPQEPRIAQHDLQEHTDNLPERPATAASTDTHHQTNGLFEDFDGVHITTHPEDPPAPLDTARTRTSSNPLPPARPRPKSYLDPRPKSYIEPPPGENMVYYPAPVPMILNLPQRLSKLPPASQRDKRRSEILGGLPADARKSAAWLPDVLEGEDGEVEHADGRSPQKKPVNRKSLADVPPQLRASAFFDFPAAQQDVELIGDSAVATLDGILDASAYAPVSAFTDHPFAGHAGPEVYGRTIARTRESMMPAEKPEHRRRRSSLNLLRRNSSSNMLDNAKKRNSSLLSLGNFGKRKSSAPELDNPDLQNEAEAASMHHEDTPLQNQDEEAMNNKAGETPDDEAEFHDALEDFDNNLENFNGQPSTLLAELQLRKQQLKTRTRTAATAFPNGMHSTLLELDTVAQVEKRSRQQKHINLAWEAPGLHHPGVENEDDEDVPLGVLFPNRKINSRARYGEDRPLGLIARRDMEDNEPLSRRRARLRGEESLPREAELAKRMSMYTLDLPNSSEPQASPEIIPDVEGETLGQRLKRLKSATSPSAVQGARPISGDFASEVLSQFGVPTPSAEVPPPPTVPEDETLGQRRKRLQAEREAAAANNNTSKPTRPGLSSRRTSMANLLQAHPAAGAGPSRSVSKEEVPQLIPRTRTRNTVWAQDVNKRASSGNLALLSGFGGVGAVGGVAGMNGATGGVGCGGVAGFAAPMNAVGRVVPHPMVSGGLVEGMEKGQRDMIERWRTSVLH